MTKVTSKELYQKLRPKDRKKAKGLVKAIAKGKLKQAHFHARKKH